MLFDASVADNFWKHFCKRRNCLKQAIPPFDTIFSTLLQVCSITLALIYGDFSRICQYVFKVVCIRWLEGVSLNCSSNYASRTKWMCIRSWIIYGYIQGSLCCSPFEPMAQSGSKKMALATVPFSRSLTTNIKKIPTGNSM